VAVRSGGAIINRQGVLPDETTFTEVRREEKFHAQFRVVEENLQPVVLDLVLDLVVGWRVVTIIRIRINVI
jgi:hypothetical protein